MENDSGIGAFGTEIKPYEIGEEQIGKIRRLVYENASSRKMAREMAGRGVLPVIVGGDLFVYSMCRMFFESYGIKPLVLIAEDVKIVTTTKFAEIMYVKGTDDEPTLLGALKAVADAVSDRDCALYVMGTGDWYARTFSKNAELLRS